MSKLATRRLPSPVNRKANAGSQILSATRPEATGALRRSVVLRVRLETLGEFRYARADRTQRYSDLAIPIDRPRGIGWRLGLIDGDGKTRIENRGPEFKIRFEICGRFF